MRMGWEWGLTVEEVESGGQKEEGVPHTHTQTLELRCARAAAVAVAVTSELTTLVSCRRNLVINRITAP